MIDRDNLIIELQQWGIVEFCDVNNEDSWIVVMTDVTTDLEIIKSITDNFLLNDYPFQETMTLIDGVLKTEYNIYE